jgi:hypothetical protein
MDKIKNGSLVAVEGLDITGVVIAKLDELAGANRLLIQYKDQQGVVRQVWLAEYQCTLCSRPAAAAS